MQTIKEKTGNGEKDGRIWGVKGTKRLVEKNKNIIII